ncbi:MazG family protein [Cellulomonas sp. ATA003]|uniref:MazG family protein n=1 Tax=Cellulomonas sp. ATA003 TaxID=3073064 RepID=UPI002873CECC|nr:MazG family protein [Cellulomonas sp. ATA003]WNB85066.1 MazG family protein [Cellulomonas sp. ATA003]
MTAEGTGARPSGARPFDARSFDGMPPDGMPPDAVPPAGRPPVTGDAPGRGVRRLVEVMDTLRSPGGCPWDAQQTHRSLVPYVLEEAHELAEAIESGDRVEMREELGDVLLQVLFHARLAQEHPTDPFDLDDVADGLTAKLVRRHPHVFAPVDPAPTDGQPHDGGSVDLHAQWDRIKKDEKNRTSVLDGIPVGQGALARGAKVLSRAHRAGVRVDTDRVAADHVAAASAPGSGSRTENASCGDAEVTEAGGTAAEATAAGVAEAGVAEAEVGARLLRLVAEAASAGVDAEAALRSALRSLDTAVRAAEAG